MSESSSRALRGGLRAVTGILIIGVAATAAVLVGAAPLPALTRDPVAVSADTHHGGQRAFVCAGSFAELGADSERPGAAIPSGAVGVVQAGGESETSELERERSGGSAPVVLRLQASASFAAAQAQAVSTGALRGLTAQSCPEPANEQWLVGGSTAVGTSTTVNLGNPGEKPATVQLAVFDENGRVDSAQTSGVLVPAGSERIVSLNGYAPGRDRLAVRVLSTGASVTASLGVGQVTGLQSFAVDAVTRQLSAATRLVVPAVANRGESNHGPNDADDVDQFRVVVRALSVTGASGTAKVRAVMNNGKTRDLGTVELAGSAVGELVVGRWPVQANAVVLESEVPIVGGVLGSSAGDGKHDTAWFAPAPELPAQTEVAAAVVSGGQLVIVNPGVDEAQVQVRPAGAGEQSYRIPAGGAVTVRGAATANLILSDTPVYAGVRVLAPGDIAGYPVLAENERAGSITVYPR